MKKVLLTSIIILALMPSILSAAEAESEHPPLSEGTKAAIAAYQRFPGERTKEALLSAIEEAYDAVIETKKTNLAEDQAKRDETVAIWLSSVLSGGDPPFLTISGDDKEAERAAVYTAIEEYNASKTEENRKALEASLAAYYDAFLYEQEVHVIETIELKEERILSQLEYFTNTHVLEAFTGERTETVPIEETLGEIIASYISTGAQIVPVNPQARVRERAYNASIKEAQLAALASPTDENLTSLRARVEAAFLEAYEVRVEELSSAEGKGLQGGAALFAKFLEEGFLETQYRDLTEQRNLYGRIDRMVTFGTNTHGTWSPRLSQESEELYELILEYRDSPDRALRMRISTLFYEIYDEMLSLQNVHIMDTEENLDLFVDEIMEELI